VRAVALAFPRTLVEHMATAALKSTVITLTCPSLAWHVPQLLRLSPAITAHRKSSALYRGCNHRDGSRRQIQCTRGRVSNNKSSGTAEE
jgi:hypothetical protein